MNNFRKYMVLSLAAFGMLLGITATQVSAQKKTNDEFFVISSIDRNKHILILLQATEISQIMNVTDKTQFFDERGKVLKLADVRSGDCVYIVSHKQQDGSFVADRVTEGTMTVAELRRRYVPYLPANAGQFASGNGQPK